MKIRLIKNLTILALLVLTCSAARSQKKLKRLLLIGTGQLASGFLDGTIESISYHYSNGFKLRCPNANDQFWDPSLSWKNKYKNGDPNLGPKFAGSTTGLVFTTDAYHMLRTSKRAIDMGSIVYLMNDTYCNKKISKKQKLKTAAKDFIVLTAMRCVGFHLSYSYLFKRQSPK